MHRTIRATVLGAVAIAAALGLGACGDNAAPPAPSSAAPAPITKPPTVAQPPTAPTMAPLPPPSALTDVLARITDASIPGDQKLDAIEAATPADAAAMDKLGQALRDGGYQPAIFEAKDLRWSEDQTGNVLAVVTIKTANEQAGDFTFPMEFRFANNHWQLARRTADAMLQLGQAPPPTP